MKRYIAVFLITALFLMNIGAIAADVKYEIYNNGEFTGITSVMIYMDTAGDEWKCISINDIYKLGLDVKEGDDLISISNGDKVAEIYFDGTPLKLSTLDDSYTYTFKEPIISAGAEGKKFLKLDIIGKCFSSTYKGSLHDGIWRIYLDTEIIALNRTGTLTVEPILFDFENEICVIQMQNDKYYGIEDAVVCVAYYTKKGGLIGLDVKKLYDVEPKEECTSVVPLNKCFDEASQIKIMFWDGGVKPVSDVITVKNFKFDSNIKASENHEDREVLFWDVEVTDKYYEALYALHYNEFENVGMFNGYEDGTYRPAYTVTRAEFAHILAGIIGMNFKNIDVECRFEDVPGSHWAKNAIGFSVSKGIMTAENGLFRPGENVLYEEALTALLKLIGEKDFSAENIFGLAEKYGLVENVIEEDEVTRGNLTQILYNFLKRYGKMLP